MLGFEKTVDFVLKAPAFARYCMIKVVIELPVAGRGDIETLTVQEASRILWRIRVHKTWFIPVQYTGLEPGQSGIKG